MRPAGRVGDEGSAVVEFVGLVVVLLVPLVYLVLVVGRLEAATFAAEGAAREAARVFVASDEPASAAPRALAAAIRGESQVRRVTMAEVVLNDGQRLLAFNDLFVGVRRATRSCR